MKNAVILLVLPIVLIVGGCGSGTTAESSPSQSRTPAPPMATRGSTPAPSVEPSGRTCAEWQKLIDNDNQASSYVDAQLAQQAGCNPVLPWDQAAQPSEPTPVALPLTADELICDTLNSLASSVNVSMWDVRPSDPQGAMDAMATTRAELGAAMDAVESASSGVSDPDWRLTVSLWQLRAILARSELGIWRRTVMRGLKDGAFSASDRATFRTQQDRVIDYTGKVWGDCPATY